MMVVHRSKLIEGDFPDILRFLMNHFVQIINSMYHEDNQDDNIQIPVEYLGEYQAKISSIKDVFIISYLTEVLLVNICWRYLIIVSSPL